MSIKEKLLKLTTEARNKLLGWYGNVRKNPLAAAFSLLIMIGAFLLGNFSGNYYLANKDKILNFITTSQKTEKGAKETFVVGENKAEIPGEDATSEEKATFSRFLYANASEKREIDISDCGSVSPKVVRIKKGENLTFINSGADDRRITIVDTDLVVAPQKTKSIPASFGEGSGIFGVRCDTFTHASFILVDAE